MNEDCQTIIFETLSVFDLNALAEVNKGFCSAAEVVMKEKLKQKHLALYDVANEQKADIENHDRIDLISTSLISRFLRRFGHLVNDLRIYNNYTLTNVEIRQLYRLINSYCSSTLLKLHIKNLKENSIFDEFKSPFTNVEEIELHGDFDHLNNLNFSHVFPAIRQLQWRTKIFHHVQLTEHMPHLEHYCFVNWFNQATDSIKKFIRNNPQIKSLEMIGISSNLLRFIADELPLLQNLTLHSYDNTKQDLRIHFKDVRRFKVSDYALPNNISFGPALEEFESAIAHQNSERLVEMVQSHKNTLKALRLVIGVENFDILQFADMDLIEIALNCNKESEIGDVIKLIERSKCLQRFDLRINQLGNIARRIFFKFAYKLLKERFANKWAITKTTDLHIFLDRL